MISGVAVVVASAAEKRITADSNINSKIRRAEKHRLRRRFQRDLTCATVSALTILSSLSLPQHAVATLAASANVTDEHELTSDQKERKLAEQRKRLAERRRLSQSQWTAEAIQKLQTLDYVLDESDDSNHPQYFIRNRNGVLRAPSDSHVDEDISSLENEDEVDGESGEGTFYTVVHNQKARLGPTSKDQLKIWSQYQHWQNNNGDRHLRGSTSGSIAYNKEGGDAQPDYNEKAEDISFVYADGDPDDDLGGYKLVYIGDENEDLLHHHQQRELSTASSFVDKYVKEDPKAKDQGLLPRGKRAVLFQKVFPQSGTKIGDIQAFGAKIANSKEVKLVQVQFKPERGLRTTWKNLPNKGTFDWFQKEFGGFLTDTAWSYRMRAKDVSNYREITAWMDLLINIDRTSNPTPLPTSPPSPSSQWANPPISQQTLPPTSNPTEAEQAPLAPAQLLHRYVQDEPWDYGGKIQYSSGRVLFFMDNNPYVCTGTVVDDGDHPDRTIILTAGHCAFQYSSGGGRFADYALFIPNQDETRGRSTDETCSNDPLGCWHPLFAVVDYDWTTKDFPSSVPYDFAFWVIPNDNETHEPGYIYQSQQDLSRVLEDIVERFPIDFTYDQSNAPATFTHGLGYTFSKDPDFRYCAQQLTTKYGISSYENLWLSPCDMSGGSSGGPWLKDTTDQGTGTIISINSWGYSSSTGMAGPNFNTEKGSKVECLFEKAKVVDFNDAINGGVIVSDC